jgi:DNA-3-methyladenine glycosylase
MTSRNGSLFLCRGHAYVYVTYGKFCMLNVVSKIAGVGARMLIRALKPMDGIPIMQRNCGAQSLRHLTRGPGRLTVALEIDRRLDGTDLCRKGPLWLACDDQNLWKSGEAHESAFRVRSSTCCASISAAIGSSAV